jgi:hypothetical protein
MCNENCFDCFSCSCCKNKCFKKTSCVLIPIIYLIVLVLTVFSGALALISFQNFSGVVCVGVKFVDSFILGEKRDSTQKWAGISLVSSLLGKLENLTKTNETQANNINTNKNHYVSSWADWEKFKNISKAKNSDKYFDIISPRMNLDESEEKKYSISPNHAYKWNEILNEIYEYDEAEASNIENIFAIITKYLYILLGCETDEKLNIICKNESDISQFFKSATDIVLGVNDTIGKIETSLIDPVKDIYDGVKNIILIIYAVVVILVIFYCILIEVLLGVFCLVNESIFSVDFSLLDLVLYLLIFFFFLSLSLALIIPSKLIFLLLFFTLLSIGFFEFLFLFECLLKSVLLSNFLIFGAKLETL